MSRGLRLQDLAFLGRVGNSAVTPLSFPGLHRWYKADSYTGIAANGESVGGGANQHGPWIEQTGSGDNGNGAGIFKTNQVGVQPTIKMNFSMEFAPGVLNDFTVLYLAKTYPAQPSFLFYHFTTGHQIRQQFFGSRDPIFYAGGALIIGTLFTGNNFDVCECKRSGGNITFRQNQVDKGGGFENTPWQVHQIGNSSSAGNETDVGEILIYNTALSTANVNALYNEYLKPKWSLP